MFQAAPKRVITALLVAFAITAVSATTNISSPLHPATAYADMSTPGDSGDGSDCIDAYNSYKLASDAYMTAVARYAMNPTLKNKRAMKRAKAAMDAAYTVYTNACNGDAASETYTL